MGAAVGDALGAPFEGAASVSWSTVEKLEREPGPLRYTDDTHMTLGVARSLVGRRGFDGDHMATLLARNYMEEPWRGYGAGPPQVFHLLSQGVPWDQSGSRLFGGSGSYGNGAAMRVAPVALLGFHDMERVVSLARRRLSLPTPTSLVSTARCFRPALLHWPCGISLPSPLTLVRSWIDSRNASTLVCTNRSSNGQGASWLAANPRVGDR